MVLTNASATPSPSGPASTAAAAESRGHLLLTGSVADRKSSGSLYSCTKWAVTAMSEAARLELHGSEVRVTLLARNREDALLRRPGRRRPARAGGRRQGVMFALGQPPHVDVNEILMRPTIQDF